jgi:hypothetical protein
VELRGIVPAIVPAPPPEPFAVQVIIVDWLYREVDGLPSWWIKSITSMEGEYL